MGGQDTENSLYRRRMWKSRFTLSP